MNILISNDDGYFSDGIQCLRDSLLDAGHQVFMVAPDRDYSACSMSITLRQPVTIRSVANNEYAVSGTPVDCVAVALGGLIKGTIDLVVSGINNGANLSDDVFYSGTAAAAMEARRLKYPSIAVSIPQVKPKHFATAASVVNSLIDKIETLPNKEELAFLNVNVPDVTLDELKGLKSTALGLRNKPEPHREEMSEKGVRHCWLGGVGSFVEPESQGQMNLIYDHQCIEEGYASITPIKSEWLHQPFLNQCQQWLDD